MLIYNFRQLIVEFSYTTYVDTVKIAVRAEDSEISLSELNGETITTIASTSIVQVIKNYEEANNVQFNVIYTNNNDESLALLASGEAKAWVYEATSMAATIASSPNPADYVIVGEPLSYAPFGLMFQLNDPNFAAVVNEAILKIFKSKSIYNQIGSQSGKMVIHHKPPVFFKNIFCLKTDKFNLLNNQVIIWTQSGPRPDMFPFLF